MAVSLVPAFGTLYQRLTLPESTRYLKSTQSPASPTTATSSEEESFDEKKPKVDSAKITTGSAHSSEELGKKVEGPVAGTGTGVAKGHRSHFQGVLLSFVFFSFSLGIICWK